MKDPDLYTKLMLTNSSLSGDGGKGQFAKNILSWELHKMSRTLQKIMFTHPPSHGLGVKVGQFQTKKISRIY